MVMRCCSYRLYRPTLLQDDILVFSLRYAAPATNKESRFGPFKLALLYLTTFRGINIFEMSHHERRIYNYLVIVSRWACWAYKLLGYGLHFKLRALTKFSRDARYCFSLSNRRRT